MARVQFKNPLMMFLKTLHSCSFAAEDGIVLQGHVAAGQQLL
jgi:hypothetical protein